MRIQIHTHKCPYTPSGIYAINKISALLSVETYLHLQAYNDDDDDDNDDMTMTMTTTTIVTITTKTMIKIIKTVYC